MDGATSPALATIECSVITSGERPFLIKAASDSWFSTWGFEPAEAIGASISVLNGSGYDKKASLLLMAELERIRQGMPAATVRCTNTSKRGRRARMTWPCALVLRGSATRAVEHRPCDLALRARAARARYLRSAWTQALLTSMNLIQWHCLILL